VLLDFIAGSAPAQLTVAGMRERLLRANAAAASAPE
jgi:hypothetical protein